MQMLNNRVLIKPDPKKDMTKGGIAIPEKHQDAPESGVIVFPKERKGTRVWFFSYSAKDIILNNEKYLILPEKELLMEGEENEL